jgi:CRP-like cAMP-binding protein
MRSPLQAGTDQNGSSDPALILHLVEECPLLRGLPPAALDEAASAARVRDARRREVLHREGEPVREVSILARGRVKLSHWTGDRQSLLVRVARAGEVCDWPGLLTNDVHLATAVAAEPSRVLTLERARLDALFDAHPELYRNALRILARWQRELADRYQELSELRVPQRLALTLLRLASADGRRLTEDSVAEIPLSRRELAQLAGTTLFTVSRLVSDWEAAGILEARRENLRVKRPAALVAVARPPEG